MAKTKAKKVVSLPHVTIGSYMNKPLIQFHKSQENADQRPFQFGPAKCQALLKAIEVNGVDKVLAKLREVAESGNGGE